jgi:uncharacterized protein
MLKPYLYIDTTSHAGRGVFTKEKIAADIIDKTKLHDYIFEWGKEKDKCCMALGLIPMYNHSYKSNCEYIMDYEEDVMIVQTVRAIEKGEELTINYNGDWNDENKIWFDAK